MKIFKLMATAAVAAIATAAPAQAAATRSDVAAPVQATQGKMLKRASQGVSTRSKNVTEAFAVTIPLIATGVAIGIGNSNDSPVSPGG